MKVKRPGPRPVPPGARSGESKASKETLFELCPLWSGLIDLTHLSHFGGDGHFTVRASRSILHRNLLDE